MDLEKALAISAAGMNVQGTRLRVIAENLANTQTICSAAGADTYRRKTVTFSNEMNRELGTETVTVRSIDTDKSDLPLHYDPSHPAADANGYVKMPNVNSFIEIMDARDAQRSYEANLNVMASTRSMLSRTIDMLK